MFSTESKYGDLLVIVLPKQPPKVRIKSQLNPGIVGIVYLLTEHCFTSDLESRQYVPGLARPRRLTEPPLRVRSVKTSL